MSNSSEPKIRVDQSHCNYQLSNYLRSNEWEILFRDPGRVSRGSSGTQATVLGIFERTGLPIPDIAAVKNGNLLLIEVDKSAKNNQSSFSLYRQNARMILAEFSGTNISSAEISKLLVGFCKVGSERAPQKLFELYELDMVASFESALIPSIFWK